MGVDGDEVCPLQGKVRMTFPVAVKAAKRARRVHSSNECEYLCRACGWWHVGSQARQRQNFPSPTRMRRRRSRSQKR